MTYASKKYKYVLDLGYHKKGTKVNFRINDNKSGKIDFRVYRLNTEVVGEFTDMVNSNERLENIVQTDTGMKGSIDMRSAGQLVLQIPYENGWTLKVDGKEAEIETFDSLYISVPLEKGSHRVELSFYPKGFREGLLISLIALLLIVISFVLERESGSKPAASLIGASEPFDEKAELKALEELEREKARERERDREEQDRDKDGGDDSGKDKSKDKEKDKDKDEIPGDLVGV